jgi:hypothetical protein
VVIGVYQEGAEPLRASGSDRVADVAPAGPAAVAVAPAPPPEAEEPSIEEIVARAEAQAALEAGDGEASAADDLPPADPEEEEPS